MCKSRKITPAFLQGTFGWSILVNPYSAAFTMSPVSDVEPPKLIFMLFEYCGNSLLKELPCMKIEMALETSPLLRNFSDARLVK